MITGRVSEDGIPVVLLSIAGQSWPAIVDTGFNGDLELPEILRASVNARFKGRFRSLLAGGQTISEDTFQVDFPFDGQAISAEASFVVCDQILIGTGLLRNYRLDIDFPAGSVQLEQVRSESE